MVKSGPLWGSWSYKFSGHVYCCSESPTWIWRTRKPNRSMFFQGEDLFDAPLYMQHPATYFCMMYNICFGNEKLYMLIKLFS